MFTNNFINLQNSLFTGETNFNIKNSAGTAQLITLSNRGICEALAIGKHLSNPKTYNSIVTTSSTTPTTYAGVYFGSGSTPANKSDYTLESVLPQNSFKVSGLVSGFKSNGNGQYVYSADFVLRNISNETILVNEIGLVTPIVTNVSTSSVSYVACLMERTVLDETVVISPGESKLITYEIIFNQPSIA